MNIFILDMNHKKNAEYHTDKHIVKMITETAQLLCSVYYFTNHPELSSYKLTHKNHPCSIWCRESLSNWVWLRDLGLALYDEYKYRYNNKIHKSGEVIRNLLIPNLIDKGLTKFPQAMPLEYKELDPVKAYRNYYKGDKTHLFKWTKRTVPYWI